MKHIFFYVVIMIIGWLIGFAIMSRYKYFLDVKDYYDIHMFVFFIITLQYWYHKIKGRFLTLISIEKSESDLGYILKLGYLHLGILYKEEIVTIFSLEDVEIDCKNYILRIGDREYVVYFKKYCKKASEKLAKEIYKQKHNI